MLRQIKKEDVNKMKEKIFDAEKSAKLLKKVFLTKEVRQEFGSSEELVNKYITPFLVNQIYTERKNFLPKIRSFKEEIEKLFPEYRVIGRAKSLVSIFGKVMKNRSLADIFGIKIIVPTVEDCYSVKEWLFSTYHVVHYEDKIKNPKDNGYSDLKVVILFDVETETTIMVEFLMQSQQMYIDSQTIQSHSKAYPWKYQPVILELPVEYQSVDL